MSRSSDTLQACRELLLEARDEAARRLAEYGAVRRELADEEEHAADRPYWLLTVSAGEHGARAVIAWADEALAALDELDPPRGRSEKR